MAKRKKRVFYFRALFEISVDFSGGSRQARGPPKSTKVGKSSCEMRVFHFLAFLQKNVFPKTVLAATARNVSEFPLCKSEEAPGREHGVSHVRLHVNSKNPTAAPGPPGGDFLMHYE